MPQQISPTQSSSGSDLLDRIAAGIRARTRFDEAAHLRLLVGAAQVGWLPRAHAQVLRQLDVPTGPARTAPLLGPEKEGSVALLPSLDDFDARTAALDHVARRLAATGQLRGWRDERFPVTAALDAPAFATIERAAARYFGLLTFAAHMNGVVEGEGESGGEPLLWIGRRSDSKAVDPGMWDNVVAGGVPHGSDPLATLVRECDEESGIPAALAQQASAQGQFEVLREIDEGVQWEVVYRYDLLLPASFVPVNRDGEVAEHRCVRADAALAIMADCAMTLDATLVTLDMLHRRRWIGLGPALADLL